LCVIRAKNIPTHINTLVKVFRNIDPSSKYKKILALILALLSGIIPFITFALIPFTGVPILGIFTSSLAFLLSFILICLAYEFVIDPLLGSGTKALKDLGPELKKMKDDYSAIKNKTGPRWMKLSKKFKKFLDDNVQTIYDIEDKLKVTTQEACDKIEEYVTPSINELKVYINNNAHITVSKEELAIIQEKIEAWKKVGISTAVGTGAGIASASATQSILVPATLWNSTLSVFGLGSGVLVSSSTFALATTVFPVSIGGAVFVGSMFAFKKREKTNLSKFLSDVIISSMPIIYADGKITEDEISQIQRLSSNPEIRDTDRKRILKALENPIDLDYVCDNFIMYDKKSKKAEIKARLLLSIAWELAKVDEEIHPKEVEMHDRMAKIFAVEENYTREVRLLLTPSYASA
jgi:uncharacterized tellurite resistance protein B-like protein/ElaB/YqjD/DUF883 family membrane-anchored ribosome-binding protein